MPQQNRYEDNAPHNNRDSVKCGIEDSDIDRYNPSNIFARARLVKTRHVTQYAPTKIGEYPSDIPQFK